MDKNKRPGLLTIGKELFVETITALHQQYAHDEQCAKAIGSVFPNDFISAYDNHLVNNQLVKLLQVAFNDNHKDSWIEYFMYELDFGTKANELTAQRKDGTAIDITTAAKLYEFLTEE